MTGRTLPAVTAAASLALAACAHPPPARSPEAPMPTASSSSLRMMPVKEWPLRFRSHSFAARCYDTYGCRVVYARIEQRADAPDQLRPSSASYGPDYRRGWSGTHLMIRNFPGPVQVSWRSKDGEPHEAVINVAEIFKDGLIRHEVPRNEMADVPDGKYLPEPAIILEVNDRVIRVYMQAHIPTKQLQDPSNRFSGFRDDPILVWTRAY